MADKRQKLVEDLEKIGSSRKKLESELAGLDTLTKGLHERVNDELVNTGKSSVEAELGIALSRKLILQSAVEHAKKKEADARFLLEDFDRVALFGRKQELDEQLSGALSGLFDAMGEKGLKGQIDKIHELTQAIRDIGGQSAQDMEIHINKANDLYTTLTDVLLQSWRYMDSFSWIKRPYTGQQNKPGFISGFGRYP